MDARTPRRGTVDPTTHSHNTHTNTHAHTRPLGRQCPVTPPRPTCAAADLHQIMNACIGIHEARTARPAASNSDQLPAGRPARLKCLRLARGAAPAAPTPALLPRPRRAARRGLYRQARSSRLWETRPPLRASCTGASCARPGRCRAGAPTVHCALRPPSARVQPLSNPYLKPRNVYTAQLSGSRAVQGTDGVHGARRASSCSCTPFKRAPLRCHQIAHTDATPFPKPFSSLCPRLARARCQHGPVSPPRHGGLPRPRAARGLRRARRPAPYIAICTLSGSSTPSGAGAAPRQGRAQRVRPVPCARLQQLPSAPPWLPARRPGWARSRSRASPAARCTALQCVVVS
jgi:hypothetical protein